MNKNASLKQINLFWSYILYVNGGNVILQLTEQMFDYRITTKNKRSILTYKAGDIMFNGFTKKELVQSLINSVGILAIGYVLMVCLLAIF